MSNKNFSNPLYKRGNDKNFWLKLKKKKPILALAPMAGITDCAFRALCREMGADVVYSEMVSADALYYDSKKTMGMLAISKKEHPVVVQLFGKRPELFPKAAKIAESAGADGIDINFGCPVPKIVKDNSGVTLMRNLSLSKKIVQTVLDVVDIPVSVKIRASINTIQRECEHETIRIFKKVTALDFMKNIIDLPISAVMVHGRTYEQGFSGEPDYEMIKDVVDLMYIWRGDDAVVLGNGGIKSVEDARIMLEETGADGLGIAQGVLGKPWIFKEIKEYLVSGETRGFNVDSNADLTLRKMDEIKKIALRHAKLAYKMKGAHGIIEMRKHLLWYVKGFPNAKELREKLAKVKSIKDIERML